MKIDIFILRRFQTLSDLLSPWVGCYTLAKQFLILAGINFVAVALIPQSLLQHLTNSIVALIWAPSIYLRLKLLDQQKERYNIIPKAAWLEWPLRLMIIGWCVLTSVTVCLLNYFDIKSIIQCSVWFLLVPALYFSACIQKLPPPKTLKVPIEQPA